MRKQSIKNSKTMLSCGRSVLLVKAVKFKKISEDIQINHEIDAKNITKQLKNQFKSNSKNDAEKHRKISTKRSPTLRFAFPSEAIGVAISWGGAFFCDLFFGTSGEYRL